MDEEKNNARYHLKFHEQQQGEQVLQLQSEKEITYCPSCGAALTGSGDICEACGKWTLAGQCCFCYATVADGQKFCKSCGNPPQGIACPQCTTYSIFDFCPQCDSPLSKSAKPYLEAMQQSEEYLKLKDLSTRLQLPDSFSQSAVVANQLDQLNAYMNQMQESKQAPKQAAFSFKNENKDVSEELSTAEQASKGVGSTEAKQAENDLRQKISAIQQQVFADNQSARKFYTAIKLLLPELQMIKTRKIIGWLCNFANVLHIQGPSNCGGPSEGGRWIYEDDVNIGTVYIEQ